MDESVKSILLVDDHAIVRQGIRMILERSPELRILGECATLKEAYARIASETPDLIILDLKLPDGEGSLGCRELRKRAPSTKILVLSAFSDDALVVECIRNGADGFLLKNIDTMSILTAVRRVLSGESVLDSSMLASVLDAVRATHAPSPDALTALETDILDLLTTGMTNREIAARLYIAEKTVRNYVSRILKKIQVKNRTEAALYWSRHRPQK